MIIKLLVDGGDMKPGPALSQKLGPIGINIGQIIQKVNEATKEFKGLKIPIEVEVEPSTKEFDIKVFSPPVSELLKKELGIEKGSGEQNKIQVANASIEQIISVAKTKLQSLLSKDLKSAVKTVVGTCMSLGILIENKPAFEIEKEIDEGKYDKEIQEARTETPPEKKEKLDEYFAEVQKEQEKIIQEEQAAKEAEAEKAEKEGEVAEATPPEEEKEEEKK
ncbi:hypothetical protein ES702_05423 [subsurface metagenome]